MNYDSNKGAYVSKRKGPMRDVSGHITYDNIVYDSKKSYRNRCFMNRIESEYNNGFGSKFYNNGGASAYQ